MSSTINWEITSFKLKSFGLYFGHWVSIECVKGLSFTAKSQFPKDIVEMFPSDRIKGFV